jgi:hypothetical protein
MSEKSKNVKEVKPIDNNTKIQILSDGPIMVEGNCSIIDKEGNETLKQGKFFLCRCGGSKNNPYCDGTHKSSDFDK